MYNYFEKTEYKGYTIGHYVTYRVKHKHLNYGEQPKFDIYKGDDRDNKIATRDSLDEAKQYIDNLEN
jgi:hypothetical protein